jgi:hypothetical protein
LAPFKKSSTGRPAGNQVRFDLTIERYLWISFFFFVNSHPFTLATLYTHLFLLYYSSFLFACPKRNEAKKKGPKNVRTEWIWAPCGVRHAGNKAIRLDFWAVILWYFLLPPKESTKKKRDVYKA